jgi:hypothetical protein
LSSAGQLTITVSGCAACCCGVARMRSGSAGKAKFRRAGFEEQLSQTKISR